MSKKIALKLENLIGIENYDDYIYFKIVNSLNKQIDFIEAYTLIDDRNFYTIGKESIIVDLDKYVPKEMTKFVMEKDIPVAGIGIIPWIIGTIIFLIIGAIVGYRYMTGDTEGLSVTNTPIINTPLESKPVFKEPTNSFLDNFKTSDDDIIIASNPDINIDKQLYEANLYNEKLLLDFNSYKKDIEFIKSENVTLIKENEILKSTNISLINKNKNLELSVAGSVTPLQNFLGIELYKKCKDSEKINCNKLFYYFYNQN